MTLRVPPDTATRWLVAYDIANDARRTTVAKTLLRLGQRIQYSVFLLELSRDDVRALVARLDRVVHPLEDRVDLIPICGRCNNAWRRIGSKPADPDAWIVI